MKLYKVLDGNGESCHGGDSTWSLPTQNENGAWHPGDWMPEIEGELEPCENGYHVVRFDQLSQWLHTCIFEVEVDGELIEAEDKYVCRKCRLVRELMAWNTETQRRFSLACARHVECLSKDPRVKKCNDTTERYLNGEATKEEWEIAYLGARDAIRVARYPHLARVARAAAYAASYAAYAVSAAAAASYAANAAADAYAIYTDAAYADERKWQAETLSEMLGEDVE
jgi:hypothetical protein